MGTRMPAAPPPLSTPRSAARQERRFAVAAGYTAVEVLMAMTVMAIGAAAVISMQKATIQGDMDARQTDIANSIARIWVERLQKEAMRWTLPSSSDPVDNNFASAKLLANHVTGSGAPTWFLPIDEMGGTPETWSPGFDILGRDVVQAKLSTDAHFCANVRLTWLVPQALPGEPGLIRADVRVLWPRDLYNSPLGGTGSGFCVDAVATLDNPDPYTLGQQPKYHAIYLTTTIKENASP
jgi:prepilin-type N-terminal cleavage/methylation domain-containing protein